MRKVDSSRTFNNSRQGCTRTGDRQGPTKQSAFKLVEDRLERRCSRCMIGGTSGRVSLTGDRRWSMFDRRQFRSIDKGLLESVEVGGQDREGVKASIPRGPVVLHVEKQRRPAEAGPDLTGTASKSASCSSHTDVSRGCITINDGLCFQRPGLGAFLSVMVRFK